MKYFIFLIGIVILSFNSSAQNWETVHIDSAVSFKLPKGFKKTKVEGENNFSAQTSFGIILIFKAADDSLTTPDIEKDKHLNKFYNTYLKRIEISSPKGVITDEKDTLLGDLKVKDFTLAIDSGSGTQIRKFRILHANNATYTFEFLFEELHKEYAAEECNIFFNSILINEDIQRSDQFNSVNTQGSNKKYYFIAAGGLAVSGIILFFFFRKSRRAKIV